MGIDQQYLLPAREPAPLSPQKPRLLDRVRMEIRTRHYSRRTEKSYVGWMRRFILFHGKRHPLDMGEQEIGAFLSSPAVDARVSASTQNQAFSALLFFYRDVLRRDVAGIENVVRARVPRRLPVVMTRRRWRECSPNCRGHRG
ncbi:MAG TPA: phage integrase N-terminal SAM-like domain-containing protein [Dehalococcoidia bacterium]|nr:phage integrase N-terminal SAM-like domain-containing protein [Dehalococcoidia bacterium]